MNMLTGNKAGPALLRAAWRSWENAEGLMETVLYEVAGGVAKLTLNRPDVLNSLNT